MTTSINDSSLETFRNDQYTITTSLSDHHIIIHLTNNLSYLSYDGKFNASSFRMSFDLSSIFKLINKCFAEFTNPTSSEPAYKASIRLDVSNDIPHTIIEFHCMVDGFLKVEFSLRLREKPVVDGTAGLSIELNTQKQLVADLTKQIEDLERIIEQSRIDFKVQLQDNINTNAIIMSAELEKKTQFAGKLKERLEMQDAALTELVKQNEILHKTINTTADALSNAYNLLYPGNEINTCVPTYCYKMNSTTVEISAIIYSGSHIAPYYPKIKLFYNLKVLILRRYRFPDLTNFSNATVKKIQIDCFGEPDGITSLAGIENFPELETIEIHNSRSDLVGPLTACKHKIKSMIFSGCNNIHSISAYCRMNNIELKIT